MAKNSLNGTLRSLVTLLEVQHLRAAGDQELVQRFAQSRDEAAFRVIAERHGPMVHGVCLRALGCPHDAEDAFQATFLILSQRAKSIRKSASLASWLHGVARRVAGELLRSRQRRERREQTASTSAAKNPVDDMTWAEVKTGLDEELERLPATYREVLVLCYLEGQTRDEAAQHLGMEVGVVKGRLERGRKLLADRMTKRGLTLSAGLLTVALSPGTVSAVVRAGSLFAAGESLAAVVSPHVISLTNNVLKGMAMTKLKLVVASMVCSVLLAVGVGFGIAQTPYERQAWTYFGGASKASKSDDTDEAFIRRVSKDLRGIDPSPAEVHFFVNSKDPKRRDKLVDLFIKERETRRQPSIMQLADLIDTDHDLKMTDHALEALAAAGVTDVKFVNDLAAHKRKINILKDSIEHKKAQLDEFEAVDKLRGKGSVELTRKIEQLKAELSQAQRQLEFMMLLHSAAEQQARDAEQKRRNEAKKGIGGGDADIKPAPTLGTSLKVLELRKELAVLNFKAKKLAVEEALQHPEQKTRDLGKMQALQREVELAEIALLEAELNLAKVRAKEKSEGKSTPPNK